MMTTKTKMTKISLFVLAGMISGGSVDGCDFPCYKKKGICFCLHASSFVSLEEGGGVGRERYSQEKKDYGVGIHWTHALGDKYIDTFEYDDNDASDEVEYWVDDMWLASKDEDGEEDDLDLEDEPNVNGILPRSYLRTNY